MSKSRSALTKDFKKQGKDLYDNGECFHTWLIRLLDLPPVTPKVPFQENKVEEKSVTERHSENAKRRVEEWKEQMEEKENAFKIASNDLLIVSHNITEKIIAVARAYSSPDHRDSEDMARRSHLQC